MIYEPNLYQSTLKSITSVLYSSIFITLANSPLVQAYLEESYHSHQLPHLKELACLFSFEFSQFLLYNNSCLSNELLFPIYLLHPINSQISIYNNVIEKLNLLFHFESSLKLLCFLKDSSQHQQFYL